MVLGFSGRNGPDVLTINVEPPAKVPWWKYDPGKGASLGCGTLILIAIIVAMFGSDEDAINAIRDLREDIQVLEQKIDRIEANSVAAPRLIQ